MDIDKMLVKDIKKVHERYIGGFMDGHHAMTKISNILDRKYIEGTDVSIINSVTGETLTTFKTAIIGYK